MSTALLSPTAPKPGIRLLTAADLAALPKRLPSGDVRYELDDGRLVVMPPAGDIHASGQAQFLTELVIQGQRAGHGVARGEVGVVLRQGPDRVVGPDSVFVTNRSLPLRRSKEGYLLTIPELVVEIRSKNDTQPEIDAKIAEYFEAGVSVIWLADPLTRTVTVHRADRTPEVLGHADVLTEPFHIPGFQKTVGDFFVD